MARNARLSSPPALEVDTRSAILDAADRQLRRFGPEKLTVLDIAREAGMSHPNLYRFFASKSEILDAVVARWLEGVEQPLAAIVAEGGPAAARLRRFILDHHALKACRVTSDAEMFRCYGAQLGSTAKVAVAAHLRKMADMMASIIADGVRAGEFAPDIDPMATAVTVREATILFHNPTLLPAVLEAGDAPERLDSVVRLLLAGMRPR